MKHKSICRFEIGALSKQASNSGHFLFELLQRPREYDWRQKTTAVRLLSLSEETTIGLEEDEDDRIVRLGCLEHTVSEWCDFGHPGLGCQLIHCNPLASDIVQGTLGNCWFLCALSLVAERPELLQQILRTTNEEFTTTKKATVRLFRFGRWNRIQIDACLPCNAQRRLVFSKAKRCQLYVPLIEKALAKLYGGYDRLVGGHLSEAMTSLTGFPCEILWLPPNNKLWTQDDVYKLLSTNRYETMIAELLEDLWIRLVSFHSIGFLLSVSCGKNFVVKNKKIVDFNSSESFQKLGLLSNHAYSILDLKQLDNGSRLVKLRNPWGGLVWNGAFSDWSPPEQNKAQKEKGTFWISLQDLACYFEQIIVGKVHQTWHQYAFEGSFPQSFVNAKEGSIFEIQFDNDNNNNTEAKYGQVIITLYQQTQNDRRRAILLTLYELVESVATKVTPVLGSFCSASVCNVQNCVTLETEIKRGKRYLLGVFAFDRHEDETHTKDDFVLRVYSSQSIRMDPHRCPNLALLGDMLIHYTMATGDVSRPQSDIEIYQSSRSWAGVVAVVKNNHPKRHLAVSMAVSIESLMAKAGEENEKRGCFESVVMKADMLDGTLVRRSKRECQDGAGLDAGSSKHLGKVNDDHLQWQTRFLVSSRRSFQTFDIIPPGSCQLVNLVTIRELMDKYILLSYNFESHKIHRLECVENNRPRHDPQIHSAYGLHSPRIL